MSSKEELVVALLKATGLGNATWKTIVTNVDKTNIDQFNQNNYYQVYDFDGYITKIANQSVFVIREYNMVSKLSNIKYTAYITNNEGRIVTKISEDQLSDRLLLKDLYTVVSRTVDDADSNIDNLLTNIKKITKF